MAAAKISPKDWTSGESFPVNATKPVTIAASERQPKVLIPTGVLQIVYSSGEGVPRRLSHNTPVLIESGVELYGNGKVLLYTKKAEEG